jgi:hypothetical protein
MIENAFDLFHVHTKVIVEDSDVIKKYFDFGKHSSENVFHNFLHKIGTVIYTPIGKQR